MVSPYTWVTAQSSGQLVGSVLYTLHNKTVTIPAGATLKKFICHKIYVHGMQQGINNTAYSQFVVSESVSIVSGVNNGRKLYDSRRRVPMVVNAQLEAVQVKYTAWHCAGDNELGFTGECSIGKATDGTPFDVNINISMFCNVATQSTSFAFGFGEYSVESRFLYYKK